MVQLDDIDRKILNILQNDAWVTNAKLAEMVGLTPPPVLERVRKLQESGVIRRSTVILDGKALGLGFTAYVTIVLNLHQQKEVEKLTEVILKLPEVLECHHITGVADFLLKVVVKNTEGYENFILNKLSQIPGIQRMQTLVVLSTVKAETKLKL